MRKKLMAWLLAIGMTVASLTPAQGVMAYGAESTADTVTPPSEENADTADLTDPADPAGSTDDAKANGESLGTDDDASYTDEVSETVSPDEADEAETVSADEVDDGGTPDGSDIAINETNFPDYYFRNYVSIVLDKNGDGKLTTEEANAVETISTKKTKNLKNVTTLKGVEYFKKLKTLEIIDSKLTGTLDLSNNTSLEYLDVSQSDLKNTLTKVSIGGSSIEHVDVRNNVNLATLAMPTTGKMSLLYLDTSYSSLSRFPYSNCNRLVTLKCKCVDLKVLPISSPNLKSLDCSYNQLTSLDITTADKLDDLACYNNELEKIVTDEGNTKISIIKCQNNKLTKLDLPNPEIVTYLDMRNNCMQCLNYNLTGLNDPRSTMVTDKSAYGDNDTSNEYVFTVRPDDTFVYLDEDFVCDPINVIDIKGSGSKYDDHDFNVDPNNMNKPKLDIRRGVNDQPMPVHYSYKLKGSDTELIFHIRFVQEDYVIPSDSIVYNFKHVVNYPVPGVKYVTASPAFVDSSANDMVTMSVPEWIDVDTYKTLQPGDYFQFGHHYVYKFMLTPKSGYHFNKNYLPNTAAVRFALDDSDDHFFHADYICLDSQGRLWIYAAVRKGGFIHYDHFTPNGEHYYDYLNYYTADGSYLKIPTLATAAATSQPGKVTVNNYAYQMISKAQGGKYLTKLPTYWCRCKTSSLGSERNANPFEDSYEYKGLEKGKWHEIEIHTGESIPADSAEPFCSLSIFVPDDYLVHYDFGPAYFNKAKTASFEVGGIPERPEDPAWLAGEGLELAGYYLDKTFKKEYKFDKPIADGTTLYAKLVEKGNVTVTFNKNGETISGTFPETQTLVAGRKATKPDDPKSTSASKVFGGWFVDDAACNEKNRFNFNSPVNSSITLYACWINKEADPSCEVRFFIRQPDESPLGYSLKIAETQYIKKFYPAAMPSLNPDYTDKNGYDYIFKGWRIKGDMSYTLYDFSTPVSGALDLEPMYCNPVSPDGFTVNFVTDADNGLFYNTTSSRYEHRYIYESVRPKVEVFEGSSRLTEGTDYKIKYANNKNVSTSNKPATVTVIGKGRFKGKVVLPFYIMPVDIGSEENYNPDYYDDPDGNYSYIQIPQIVVQENSKISPSIYYYGHKLTAKDFYVSNKGKVKTDTSITIYGKGNFTGLISGIPVKVLSKTEMAQKTIKVSLKALPHIYPGESKTTCLTITTASTPGELTVKNNNGDILNEGSDFRVSYINNINCTGTATAVIQGLGSYTGTVKKSFKIVPAKTAKITHNVKYDILMQPGSSKAVPEGNSVADPSSGDFFVIADLPDGATDTLVCGKDYKFTTKNNTVAGTGKYTLTFMGNYKGHKKVSGTYVIKPFSCSLPNDPGDVRCPDVIYSPKSTNKSVPYFSIADKPISSKDYTVEYYDGTEKITTKKITLADAEDYKKIKVVLKGRRNWDDTQSAEGFYYIRRAKADSGLINLSKAKIVEKGTGKAISPKTYTGLVIKPEIEVWIKDGRKWVTVDPSCYSITYANCMAKGKATLYITGVESKAIGSKKASFKIVPAGMSNIFKFLTMI